MEIDDTDNGPVAKRQKVANGAAGPSAPRPAGASRLFAPYRTVGLISPTSVPFTAVPLGKTTFQITTSVGRSLQTYDLRRGLNLVFVTRPQTPECITASVAWKDKVFAAWGGDAPRSPRGIWAFKRGKRDAELPLPPNWPENVNSFCIFGSWIVGVGERRLLVWKSSTLELYTTLHGISPIPFTKCIASLPTFLNKIIIGREDGSAEVWNVSSGKLIYTVLPPSTAYGAVTALEPTPALSLVAIAYEKGQVLIHDIRTDQTLLQFTAPARVPITSISFRTDGLGAGDDGRIPGVMATASTSSGDITMWDLNDGGRTAGTLRAAHLHPAAATPGGVSKIEFLSGQAVLVSSGLDNTLKTWISDEMPFNPIPRLLHSRSGHGAPITKLHFLPSASDGSDDTGKWLMSASKDRSLWGWSLRRDGQSTELSQGAVQKKAKKQGLLSGNRGKLDDLKCPPITAIACSLNRDGGIGAIPGKHPIWLGAKGNQVDAEVSAMTGWESVVTAHEGDKKARTWFWGRKRAGRWAFETGDGGTVTSIAMSACGTFALVGSELGGIDMFNMQSGIHRQRFPARLTPLQAKQLRLDVQKHRLVPENDGKREYLRGQGKHASAVVGVAIDTLNKTVVSAGAEGKIKFWNFQTGLLDHEIDWSMSTSIKSMRFHRGTDLAAFVCTDGCVRIVDTTTFRLIRELWPSRPGLAELNNADINDFTFSNDGHWIAACVHTIVLLWDLPTGHLVDAFKLMAECKSLAFSPTGEFLATASTEHVGVDVWSNRSLFTHVPTRHIGQEELAEIVAGKAQAPAASGEGGEDFITAHVEGDIDEEGIDLGGAPEAGLEQLSADLLSLSLVPRSRWQNLLHLDLIRQRNRPVEPPKKPEKAPFFLPGLQDRQADPNALGSHGTEAEQIEKERSRVSKLRSESEQSAFTTSLRDASMNQDYARFLEYLKSLNPAAADVEIRSMSSQGVEMITYVRALTWLLHQRRDFELGQAWMAVFLRIHGDMVAGDHDQDLRSAVEEWAEASRLEKKSVQRLASYCNGVVGYLRAARV